MIIIKGVFMKIIECKEKIVCDVKGCNNVSKYYLNKKQNNNLSDSIKLCEDCAKKLLIALSTLIKIKESKNDKNN